MTEFKSGWSWQSKDNDTITCRLWFDGRTTLEELLAQLREAAPGAVDITFGGGMVMWTRGATEQELAERRAWQRQAADRHAEWERKMHAQLIAKYGPTPLAS